VGGHQDRGRRALPTAARGRVSPQRQAHQHRHLQERQRVQEGGGETRG